MHRARVLRRPCYVVHGLELLMIRVAPSIVLVLAVGCGSAPSVGELPSIDERDRGVEQVVRIDGATLEVPIQRDGPAPKIFATNRLPEN
jgi:hypothetical protein